MSFVGETSSDDISKQQQQSLSLTSRLESMPKKNKADLFLDDLLKPRDISETLRLYDQWSASYEKDIKEMGYNGAAIAAQRFLQMNFEKDSEILDIGAGTGIIGEILRQNGYDRVDALDANDEMLKILEEKKCYRKTIKSLVAPDIKLPVPERSYDVVIMAGVFCPGHIDYRSLEQIIRITKSGGFICWSMGHPKTYADRDESYRDENFERYISSLCDKCKWLSMLGYPIVVQNYMKNLPGLFYAMQVV